MKYRNRVVTTIAFEEQDLAAYKQAAAAVRPAMDFNAWVNAQCARAVKRDGRTPANRNRAKGAKGE